MFLFHMFRFISPADLPSSELLELGGSPGFSQVGAGVTVGAAGAAHGGLLSEVRQMLDVLA